MKGLGYVFFLCLIMLSCTAKKEDMNNETKDKKEILKGIGSGSDDDTLAAQLRELAMKETDPVLRERYWEEYRKHKGIK